MKRLSLAMTAAAGISVAGLSLSGAASATPVRSMPVPMDGQAYVTQTQTTNPSDGTTVDEYGGDPSVIHVAMRGGQEQARSFAHFALAYLPARAVVDQVTLTLRVAEKTDASSKGVFGVYNVNTSAAIVQACVLKSAFPSTFDRENPPAADCAHGSAAGVANKAGDRWTFQLAKLVPYWKEHGNTGLALVPIAGDPTATWSVSFSKPKSRARVSYTTLPAAPAATGKSSGTTTAPVADGGGGGGGPVSGGSTGTATSGGGGAPLAGPIPDAPQPRTQPAPADSTAPVVAGDTQAPATVPAAARTTDTGGNGAWPWVLAGSIVVAVGAIGVAHRAAVLGWLQRVVPPGIAAFRTHPRAYSVASAALAWGLVFTSYSLVTAPSGSGQQEVAGDTPIGQTTSPGATTPGTTTGPAGTTTAHGPGTATAAGGTVTSGGTVSASGGTSGGASVTPQEAAQQEFAGKGHYETINGVQVFFPADGGPPVAKLYSGADDVIGMSPDEIRICAHAALTYGPAFNIGEKDINVYWDYVNDHGGIFGRQVATRYENDNYDPGQAVTAAQACKDWETFILEGGIGFDQIPAVRQWAEQNHELYLHHVATIKGTSGQRYSFSALPTVEQLGSAFGKLAVDKFRDKKIGIIYRQSANWEPGYELFKKTVEAAGMDIVGEYGTTVNQANYTQEITQLRSAGAQVIFGWENAVAVTEMLKQAQGQNYHPAWLVFPFNLTTNTLGDSTLDQDMWGIAAWDAYDPGYYGGPFASYADEIKQFEAQYKQYDPGADLSGDGGDLLFLNWEEQKWVHGLLVACGSECTRNKIAGLLLAGFDKPVPPNCPVDFGLTSDHHHGGYRYNVFHAVRDPNGRANFVPAQRCVSSV